MANTEENKTSPRPTFNDLLSRFPSVDLPITLGVDTHHDFSQNNPPLSQALIDNFILPLESEEADELTEFIACFQLPATEQYRAVVYWRAGLLNYQYTLVTFDPKGQFIDQRVIAGTYYDGDQLTQSMATVTEELQVYIVSGQGQAESFEDYSAASSTAYRLQIGTGGKIVNL